jgi:DNA anti-recombination protein RmuC
MVAFPATTRLARRFTPLLRDELARNRDESVRNERQLRDEIRAAAKDTTDSLVRGLIEISTAQKTSLDSFASYLQGVTDAGRKQLDGLSEAIETRLRLIQEDTSRALDRVRADSSESDTKTREELGRSLRDCMDSVLAQVDRQTCSMKLDIDGFSKRLETLTESNERRLDQARVEAAENAVQIRTEVGCSLKTSNDSVLRQMADVATLQRAQLEAVAGRLCQLTESTERKLDELRAAVDARLRALQEDNSQKLELMRRAWAT